ncbi:MAG: signal peptidase I [Alistipes sp.]|nr:signal peptidase I [Alistipes sp.]
MVKFFKNKWVRFSAASAIYILLCVVWTGNLWMLLGLPLIYDYFISRLVHKHIGLRNKALCERYPLWNTIYGWIDAVVWAVVAATLIHLFVFQLYKVPTSSMEKTILIGDYLYVSKLSYGPQVPNTPLAMPFVYNTMPITGGKSYSEAIKWDYHRLKGLKPIKRNDVVVFNFPAGDTVLLENQAVTYYDVVRSYEQTYGKREGRRRLNEDYTVIARPVDKRENYIKRCVAIPGDTLRIADGQLYINEGKQLFVPSQQYIYFVQTTAPLTTYTLKKLGITEVSGSAPYYYMAMTAEAAEQLSKLAIVTDIVQYNAKQSSEDVFPNSSAYSWTQDNFGPLWVPYKGATITLTAENLPIYRRIIEQYEGHTLEVTADGEILIDGVATTTYTFAMDYYWMMGDNRHNSADSRFWGFVPEDHIVGKASFIAFSKGEDGIRWNRLFKKIE